MAERREVILPIMKSIHAWGHIGRVLDVMQEEGLDKNTVVVFVSDNGGSPLTAANNTPLTAGKYSLWEGGIRVPMILCWPGRIKSSTVQNQYVSTLDLLPTIADAKLLILFLTALVC